jgi:hypothetical protein
VTYEVFTAVSMVMMFWLLVHVHLSVGAKVSEKLSLYSGLKLEAVSVKHNVS